MGQAVSFDWRALPEPRRLTTAEQAVLDRLVAQADCAELTAQAASVWVTAVCDCGCPSVLLRTDAPPVPAETMARLSSVGREDWFGIDYSRWEPALRVVAHVTTGSLHQLEIFAGEGVAAAIPKPDELDPITII